jgi:hypothetical protein
LRVKHHDQFAFAAHSGLLIKIRQRGVFRKAATAGRYKSLREEP